MYLKLQNNNITIIMKWLIACSKTERKTFTFLIKEELQAQALKLLNSAKP